MSHTPLVTTEWLDAHLNDPKVKIVDGSWHMPNQNRDPEAEFFKEHIPGAVHFHIDKIANTDSGMAHMVAAPKVFEHQVGKLGIASTDTIVIYDVAGLFTAARVWWNFRIMGAEDVRVLSGGLPRWKEEGRTLASGPATPLPVVFKATPAHDKVKTADDVLAALEVSGTQIVDMRPADRFHGRAEEPRAGLRSGHMPGALNVPFAKLVNEKGEMKSPEEIKAVLAEHGVDPTKPIITSCGSGVTATILNLALDHAGHDHMHVYDGSWAEWGADEKRPVVKTDDK